MKIQELGPHFTLKLRSLQKETLNSKYGDYEWVHKPRKWMQEEEKFHYRESTEGILLNFAKQAYLEIVTENFQNSIYGFHKSSFMSG